MMVSQQDDNDDHHHHHVASSSSSSPTTTTTTKTTTTTTTTRPLHQQQQQQQQQQPYHDDDDDDNDVPSSHGGNIMTDGGNDNNNINNINNKNNNAVSVSIDHDHDHDDEERMILVNSQTTTTRPSTATISSSNYNYNYNYNCCRTVITILLWYGISDTIILITKWLFTTHFPFPLTVTLYSNIMSFVWALMVSKGCQWWNTTSSSTTTMSTSTTMSTEQQQQRQSTTTTVSTILPKKFQWMIHFVIPIGLCTALEIGASNLALKILTVSFGTILKGSSPIFTFGWGLFFGIEQLEWKMGLALSLIAFGIGMASLGEGHDFEIVGFVLQLFSMMLGGLRWAMTHKLLKGNNKGSDNGSDNGSGSTASSNITTPTNDYNDNDEETEGIFRSSKEQDDDDDDETTPTTATSNVNDDPQSETEQPPPLSPLQAVLYTAPVTSLGVLPFCLFLESSSVYHHIVDTSAASDLSITLLSMTLVATLVFLLLMSEYWLVHLTSSLTLSVAAVFKELILIGSGIFFFAEHVNLWNVIGFCICQGGIVSYVCLRYKKNKNNNNVAENKEDEHKEDGDEDNDDGHHHHPKGRRNNNNNRSSAYERVTPEDVDLEPFVDEVELQTYQS